MRGSVAAFPVQGPIDVLGDAPIAALDCDLAQACLRALEIPRLAARAFAITRSWRNCTEQFLSNLPVRFPIREVEVESPTPTPCCPLLPRPSRFAPCREFSVPPAHRGIRREAPWARR